MMTLDIDVNSTYFIFQSRLASLEESQRQVKKDISSKLPEEFNFFPKGFVY